MGKQGKATLWKEDSRTTELGQDTGGSRELQGRAELDFTATMYWAQ